MRAVTDGPLSPVARCRRPYLHGGINIIRCAHLYLCNDFAKARVDDILHGGTGDRVAPLTTDPVASGGVGDEVVTAGGLMGKVIKVADDYVEVEIAPNVRVKAVKSTIANVQSRGTKAAND